MNRSFASPRSLLAAASRTGRRPDRHRRQGASAAAPRRTSRRSGTSSSSTSRTRATTTTWGPTSAAPYLAKTLRGKGVLLNTYYGTAHNSQPNYVAQISGQGPNPQMQADCQIYSSFVAAGTAAPGQAVGSGCVFPANVPTLMSQLDGKGLTLEGLHGGHGYAVPASGAEHADSTQKAKVGDEYAARHDPFMYFSRSPTHRNARSRSSTCRSSRTTWPRSPRRRTSPTSRPTCATTATTRRASTAGRAGWPASTSGCAPGCPRS